MDVSLERDVNDNPFLLLSQKSPTSDEKYARVSYGHFHRKRAQWILCVILFEINLFIKHSRSGMKYKTFMVLISFFSPEYVRWDVFELNGVWFQELRKCYRDNISTFYKGRPASRVHVFYIILIQGKLTGLEQTKNMIFTIGF